MSTINISTQQAFSDLNKIQRDAGTPFSVYGPVAPFLLLCVLKVAIGRKIGAADHLDEFLNVSNGLNMPVPVLHGSDVETILDAVCDVAGDRSGALRNFFKTTIYAFDDLSAKGVKSSVNYGVFLNSIDLNDSEAIFQKAIELAVDFSFGRIRITNPSLARLARNILNVKSGETFSDFVCGVGLSSSVILGNTSNVETYLSDADIDAFACASVGCFLQNRENRGKNYDSLGDNFNDIVKSDKIFIDPPLRMRMDKPFEFNGVPIKESSCAAVVKAACSLKENGIAVICINSGFTYGTQFSMDSIRKYLIDNCLLKAVISLPNMWSGGGVLSSILILSNDNNTEVKMVDVSRKGNDSSLFIYDRSYQCLSFTEAGLAYVSDLVNSDTPFPGVSAIVSYRDVEEKQYSIMPSLFIEEEKTATKTVAEIDADIKDVLDDIQSLMRELG